MACLLIFLHLLLLPLYYTHGVVKPTLGITSLNAWDLYCLNSTPKQEQQTYLQEFCGEFCAGQLLVVMAAELWMAVEDGHPGNGEVFAEEPGS